MTVTALSRAVGMSRQNFYREGKQRQRKEIDEELVIKLVQHHRKMHPRMGARKLLELIREDLSRAGIELGRDRFFALLRRKNLLVERRTRAVSTTKSRHRFRKYPNRLKEREIDRPHQAWVSDLSYLRTQEGYLYLSLVMDEYSRKIVGWEASDGLEAQGCVKSLCQAIEQLEPGCKPLHHSDRGIQYCCNAYVKQLEEHQIEISMTEENHCYENAKAERVIGILKQEYALGVSFADKAQAREAIRQAIALYNHYRPHLSLNYARPAQVHRQVS